MRRSFLFGVPIDLATMDEAVAFVAGRVRARKRTFITTPNPEFIVDAQRDPAFRTILEKANLALPDGIGIVWALRFLHSTYMLYRRIAGVDFMLALCARAAQEGWTIGLVGGGPGLAEKTSGVLEERFPGIHITVAAGDASRGPRRVPAANRGGRVSGSKDIGRGRAATGPAGLDLLFVALGHKKQERWIVENQAQLGAIVAMGVGGAFDYISGRVPRAPVWMRRVGLEWLFRLLRQPWRITRQWKLPVFIFMILKQKVLGVIAP